ncbi:hypothetical protein [Paenibacillus nasutitermitis]|uniref:SLH domain-containing protein n=1 Tax=Paenibacillus nasutitermitis TaxID=1652958 RepID=A0A917E359_9BACL|nr:hypothetical protein [Paenibacillus nasutitermitis]GGD98444.1 hypothetical protein GCM10010911_66560 [Paenibacillus nasutitermitis]
MVTVAGLLMATGTPKAVYADEDTVNFSGGTARKPNATITREQMAVMVTRAISAAGKNVDTSSGGYAETFAAIHGLH